MLVLDTLALCVCERERDRERRTLDKLGLPALALLDLFLGFGLANDLEEKTPVVEYDPYRGEERSLVGLAK